jgi:Cu(I)/Ag(I) efflux system membrane fusion protein
MDVEVSVMVPLSQNAFLLPKSAVLWSGNESLVYVMEKLKERTYLEPRFVKIEDTEGDFYVVTEGLKEGEEVLAEGVFLVDAAAQLRGEPSFMTMASLLTSGKKYPLPPAVANILDAFLSAYFQLQQSLAEDNLSSAHQSLSQLAQLIAQQPYRYFSGKARYPFQSQWLFMEKLVIQMRKETAIEKLRHLFAQLSQALISLLQAYDDSGRNRVYLFYCPMAEENQGAYWMAPHPAVMNPYFGQTMLKCGKVVDSLPFGQKKYSQGHSHASMH